MPSPATSAAALLAPLDRLGARRRAAPWLLAAATFAGAAGVAAVAGVPRPAIHDEFVYLLQADTYAAGRLANPPLPVAEPFETFHVLQRPTYAGKYPPAQGLALAAGTAFGHPALGVWASAALMVAAVTWMLFAWVPARWAVAGGILTALQFGIVGYWAQSYWGGAVAAAAGAVVFGAFRRALDGPRVVHGVLLGGGLAVLANSRPWEGLAVALPALVVIGATLLRGTAPDRRALAARALLPAAVVLAAAFAWTLHYNRAVTGDPLRLPHQAHAERTGSVPSFLWEEASPPRPVRHAAVARFQGWSWAYYRTLTRPDGFVKITAGKLAWRILFFLGPGVLLLVLLPRVLAADPWMRVAAAGAGLALLSTVLSVWSNAHYLAPATALFMALLVGCLTTLHQVRPAGPALTVLVLTVFAGVFSVRVGRAWSGGPDGFAQRRAAIQNVLHATPGDDLVLVRYGPRHVFHEEWVYNGADLRRASIVWARETDRATDAETRALFPARRVWILEVDPGAARLMPLEADGRNAIDTAEAPEVPS